MNSGNRHSLIRHICGGILLIGIITFYPACALLGYCHG